MTSQPPSTPSQPRFHGLFIGVNRYQAVEIRNLAAAVRDATALHALFSDNLGSAPTLLTDADATTDRIRQELTDLQTVSSDDDVVVIAFSGHGSDSHELITYDTDYYDIGSTALPLSEFTELISAIPAKHLLVVLDCCFSGGAGAKVLQSPAQSRGGSGGLPLSTEAFLNAIAGTGRVILTASTAEQEAWEDPRLGHGYLTYYFLQALLGPGEIAHAGRVNLLDLLNFVTHNVIGSASSTYAARQEPTLRGRWDGEVIWPVFSRGPLYDAFDSPTLTAPVNSSIRSLAGHGMPDALLDVWSAALPSLNQLQQDAVNQGGLFQQQNMLVMAPTSSGKTMIGELAALRATQTGGRSVFLLPTKALVNEQFERFKRTYSDAGIRVVRATGDHNDDVAAILRGQFDIGVFTYEKFSGLALAHGYLLRLVSVVVVDEVQTVVDASRGRELELLLTLIKSRVEEGIEPQIVALSAVLGSLNGLDSWLGAYVLRTDKRPVPLDEGILDMRGTYRYINPEGAEQVVQLLQAPYGDARAQTLLIPLVQQLITAGQQVVVIRGERGPVRGAAEYLSNSLGLPPATDALGELPDGDLTQSAAQLRRCLAGGVAFHISDLNAEDRRVVEEHFRRPDSAIRVVVATTTLAQGVNMPAETVIMPELNRRIGGRQLGWYSVADYKNIVGRAGRLGLVEQGRAITLAMDQATANRVWTDYVNGSPEDLHSTLLGPDVDIYTVVLRVVAIAAQRSDDGSVAVADLTGVLTNSFAAHQARLRGSDDAFNPTQVASSIAELQRVGFLEVLADDRTRLSRLGSIVAPSLLSVQSAIRVTDVIRQLAPSEINVETILTTAQVTEEVDASRLTVNAKGIRKELTTFVGGLQQRRVAGPAINALTRNATDVVYAARAKKAIATMLWVGGVPLAQIETFVMQHYFDRNASGPIGQVVSRTHDVIDTVLAIAVEVHPSAELADAVDLLPLQLELGIPQPMARFAAAGADLRREDYMRIAGAGLNADTIDAMPDEELLPLVQGSTTRLASLRTASARIQAALARIFRESFGDDRGDGAVVV